MKNIILNTPIIKKKTIDYICKIRNLTLNTSSNTFQQRKTKNFINAPILKQINVNNGRNSKIFETEKANSYNNLRMNYSYLESKYLKKNNYGSLIFDDKISNENKENNSYNTIQNTSHNNGNKKKINVRKGISEIPISKSKYKNIYELSKEYKIIKNNDKIDKSKYESPPKVLKPRYSFNYGKKDTQKRIHKCFTKVFNVNKLEINRKIGLIKIKILNLSKNKNPSSSSKLNKKNYSYFDIHPRNILIPNSSRNSLARNIENLYLHSDKTLKQNKTLLALKLNLHNNKNKENVIEYDKPKRNYSYQRYNIKKSNENKGENNILKRPKIIENKNKSHIISFINLENNYSNKKIEEKGYISNRHLTQVKQEINKIPCTPVIYNSRIRKRIFGENSGEKLKKNYFNENIWDKSEYFKLCKNLNDREKMKEKNKIKEKYIRAIESISIGGTKENGMKKINQDTYIIEKNINRVENFNLFGVFDGHGEFGHLASRFVKNFISDKLKNNPLIKNSRNPYQIYEKLKQNGYEIIAKIFIDADVQIQKEKFNCQMSGTTSVIVIQCCEKLICANAGDSRAIVVFDKNNSENLINSHVYPLSFDCKPNLPNEFRRIYQFGGTIGRALDENMNEGGPFRVYLNGRNFPGLAMSRSIGDLYAKQIGVIPNPQIIEYNIDYSSKYMLICSDGIWEFIDNEEAMKIGNQFYIKNDPAKLCRQLYKKSLDLWRKEDVVIDDITAIVVFFN